MDLSHLKIMHQKYAKKIQILEETSLRSWAVMEVTIGHLKSRQRNFAIAPS